MLECSGKKERLTAFIVRMSVTMYSPNELDLAFRNPFSAELSPLLPAGTESGLDHVHLLALSERVSAGALDVMCVSDSSSGSSSSLMVALDGRLELRMRGEPNLEASAFRLVMGLCCSGAVALCGSDLRFVMGLCCIGARKI